METINQSSNSNKGVGSIIGIIVVVVILIVGAIYIFGSKVENSKTIAPVASSSQTVDTTASDISSIESDLNNVDVKTLDIDEKNI